MRKLRTTVVSLLPVFLFVACAGQVGDSPDMAIAPSPVSLEPGEALAFAATGPGATTGGPEAFTWAVEESGGGTVDAAGNYTTPDAEGTFHVVASSTADARRKAAVTVQVQRRGIRVRIAPSVASLRTGDSATFTAIVRGTRPGQSTAVTWSIQEGASGGTIDASGNYTTPAAPGIFHVVAASVADPSKKAAATVTVTADQGIAVAVAPSNASTQAQGKLIFKATVTGIQNGQSSGVTWSVEEGANGGSVDASGDYTAPASAGTAHVVATSIADPSKTAVATVDVAAAPAVAVSISPATASVIAGGVTSFSATVTGGGSQSTDVTWSVQEGASGGSIDGSGRYTAPGPAGTYHVVATSVADASKSATATVSVTAAPNITVSIAPGSASSPAGGMVNFTASVTGTSGGQSTAVSWSVQEGAAGGTINGSGVYTAPANAGTFHVIATSVADNNQSAIATVTVTQTSSSTDTTGLIPPGRVTVWAPGVPGGIPSYSSIFATIDAATYGNGSSDAAGAINSALASAGASASAAQPRVVLLTAGTFLIRSPITINSSYVVLRGAGPTQTKIIGQTGANIIRMGWKWNYTGLVNVTSDNPKGATSITLVDASAIQPGDVLQIDMVDDRSFVRIAPDGVYFKRQPSTDINGPGRGGSTSVSDPGWRSIGQQIEVASKNGNTLTLTSPLHVAFPLSQSPQVFKTATARSGEPGTRYSGIEDLYVSGGTNNMIGFVNTAYCWARNIESDGRPLDSNHGMTGAHVQLIHAFRNEIRDSYFHHATVINQGGGAYGLAPGTSSSNNLFENNIAVHLNKPIVMNNSGGGNVIAYNYVDNAYSVSAPGWQENTIDGNHESFSHSDLFEGNWTTNIGSDTTHGNAGWHVFFRNYATGRNTAPPTPDNNNIRAAGIDAWSREHTYVGNVYAGWVANGRQPVYQCTATGSCMGAEAVYRAGANAASYTDFDDGTALAHLFVNGNFDPVNNGIVWDPTLPRRDLPASLYLTSKPAFFGGTRWPFVDPLGSPMVGTLPAKQRYDAMP
jgi:hypothetical protein